MPSKKAFVDTSVLTDSLLKQAQQGKAARGALKSYAATLLPVYAIKEFKAGPLRNYVWLYNKTTVFTRWSDIIDALYKLSATLQKYKVSTALKAVADFQSSIGKRTPAKLASQYPGFNLDESMRAEAQIWLKTLIMRAWRNRLKICSQVVDDLACYAQAPPVQLPNGAIDILPVRCGVEDCVLRHSLGQMTADLVNLIAACKQLPPRPEIARRIAALNHLRRIPNRRFSEDQCRALGDAVFALQCPQDAVILTTNLKDHEPLGKALGKAVESP